MQDSYNVLFLCTGNSARSIFAEAILNHRGAPRFHAYSAGSYPKGAIHPNAQRQLADAGLSTEGLRSKSWDEFAKPGSPQMDFIFTVCDRASKEVCPIWPGHPITGHWSVPDPAAAKGTPQEIDRAFREAFFILERHIDLFVCLPHGSLDAIGMKARVAQLGRG